MLNLEESIKFLRCRQLPLTPICAINYLLDISHQYLLLGLYQHLFPAEYLKSQAQTQRKSIDDELLVQTLSRLTKILADQGRSVSLTLVDPDIVEKANIPRQNFTQPDLGLNKAQVLALRYGMVYGVDVMAIPERFEPEMVNANYNILSIVIGCVDNAAARIAIA